MDPDLADLARAYRASLAERRMELARWRSERLHRADPAQLGRLQVLAHHLAGSAGSYGFPLLGEAARSLDEQLRRSAQDASVCEAAVLHTLTVALETHLDATIAALDAQPNPLS